LRNAYFTRLRRTANRPPEREFMDNDSPLQPESPVSARELMEAIASAPEPYRDAVIAIDVLGLSYREAAASLKTLEATVTSRLHRGRQHIAKALVSELTSC
jgi:RNA polymerase sigma-70 factor, ECF subfamily